MTKQIPEDVKELLWIQGIHDLEGKTRESTMKIGGVVVDFGILDYSEPSMLRMKQVVRPCGDPEPLGYYPHISGMDECQKFTYLDWLSDITQPIDIGYVFVFYYGLERHLVMGKYEEAIAKIDILRAFHDNSSFLHYSSNALLYACLHHDRTDLFEEFNSGFQFSELYVLVKLMLYKALSREDIVASARYVGFTNRRYIKIHPDIFNEEIDRILMNRYREKFFKVSLDTIKASPRKQYLVFANYSIIDRGIPIPNIYDNESVRKDLHAILKEAHESTKERLKFLRKQ